MSSFRLLHDDFKSGNQEASRELWGLPTVRKQGLCINPALYAKQSGCIWLMQNYFTERASASAKEAKKATTPCQQTKLLP